jgi:hypothetical protein
MSIFDRARIEYMGLERITGRGRAIQGMCEAVERDIIRPVEAVLGTVDGDPCADKFEGGYRVLGESRGIGAGECAIRIIVGPCARSWVGMWTDSLVGGGLIPCPGGQVDNQRTAVVDRDIECRHGAWMREQGVST